MAFMNIWEAEGRQRSGTPNQSAEEAAETPQAPFYFRSEMLDRMSHELRTPLNAIMGYTELLIEQLEERGLSEYLADLNRIQAAGQHLLNLISDLLDLSLIDAGRMTLDLESLELEPMLDDVIERARRAASANSNELEVRFKRPLGRIFADLPKIRFVLTTLLANAARFTDHGHITFSVERTTGLSWQDEMILFEVADSGIGMTDEQLKGLFMPFADSDYAHRVGSEDSGLGLAVSRAYCLMMGGIISVESALGEGSTFSVRLPCKVRDLDKVRADERAALAETLPGSFVFEPTTAERDTVLVVDSDSAARDLIVRYLMKKGLSAISAASSDQGLRLARRLKPSIVILNLNAADGSGWTALSTLNSDPALSDIPVISMSYAEDEAAGYALGASEFLPKPVDFGRLSALVDRYCSTGAMEPLRRTRILVVDKDSEMRYALRTVLERAGWRVSEAENGLDALRLLELTKPDLVLLDLLLPIMNGFEFISEVKRSPVWRTIPLVIHTAMDLTSTEVASLGESVEKVLAKHPLALDLLRREIRDLMLHRT